MIVPVVQVQEVEGEREALEQELEQKGSELEALETRVRDLTASVARRNIGWHIAL